MDSAPWHQGPLKALEQRSDFVRPRLERPLSKTATVKRDQWRPRPWRAIHDDSKDHTRFCKGPSAGQCSLLTSHDPGRAAGSWPCVSVTKAQPPSPSSLSSPSDGPCLGYPLPNLHPRCTPGAPQDLCSPLTSPLGLSCAQEAGRMTRALPAPGPSPCWEGTGWGGCVFAAGTAPGPSTLQAHHGFPTNL